MTWGNFANFLRYNSQVNSFMPAAIRPILGVTATGLEGLFGISLFLGVCTPLAIGTGRAAGRQTALDFGAQEFVDLDSDALEDVGRSIWFSMFSAATSRSGLRA